MDLAATLEGDGAATGVPFGAELLAVTDAVLGRDDAILERCREAVRDALGKAGLADAAATLGSYNAIVKVADATGTELDAETAGMTADLCEELGLADRKG